MISAMDDMFSAATAEAIRHIGISTYSSGKIKQYLVKKGYDIDIAADVVTSLIERGYIDDMKAARQVLYLRTGKKRESREFCRKRLLEAGISEDAAYSYVSSLPEDSDSVLELYDASLDKLDSLEADEFVKKAISIAVRRGFSFECAQKGLGIWLDNRHN